LDRIHRKKDGQRQTFTCRDEESSPVESDPTPLNTPPSTHKSMSPFKEAPNISLNLHGGSKFEDLYTAAACGIVLQFGVLVFSGLAVYYPGWNLRFPKNGRLSQGYAYPLMAVGTVLLVIGMIICSAVIEKSTTEQQWVVIDRTSQSEGTGSTVQEGEQREACPNVEINTRTTLADGVTRATDSVVEICSTPVTNTRQETSNTLPTSRQPKVRLLWLQKRYTEARKNANGVGADSHSHTVSDQSFESFVIFAQGPRDAILVSRRSPNDGKHTDNNHIEHNQAPRQPQNNSRQISRWSRLGNISSNRTEAFTFLGTILSLAGFIAQFQGFRGLHWVSSISQLAAVFAMTMFRAWVRRGLIARPIAVEMLDGCEMDWLALTMAMDSGIWRFVGGTSQGQQSSSCTRENESRSPEDYSWTIATGPNNLACRGSLTELTSPGWNSVTEHEAGEERPVGEGQNSNDNISKAEMAVRVRRRLGQLTKWIGPASKPAISIASAISVAMNTLELKGNEFCWYLNVEAGEKEPTHGNAVRSQTLIGNTNQRIKFRVRSMKRGEWVADATEIEAALSLWIFHIRKRQKSRADEAKTTDERHSSDWLQEDMSLARKSTRLLGPDTEIFKRDLKWWIGDVEEFNVSEYTKTDGHTLVGFRGLESGTFLTATPTPPRLDVSVTISQITNQSLPSHRVLIQR